MFKLKSGFVVLSVIVAFLVTGCASIVSRSSYPVTINSSPDHADFIINNKDGVNVHSGKTPSTVTLKSGGGFFQGETYEIIFQKDGYSSSTATLNSSMDGWYVGNIIFGGLIGILIVDPATGAMWKLPETVSTTLYEQKAALNTVGKTLHIVNYNNIPDSEKANLIRIKQ